MISNNLSEKHFASLICAPVLRWINERLHTHIDIYDIRYSCVSMCEDHLFIVKCGVRNEKYMRWRDEVYAIGYYFVFITLVTLRITSNPPPPLEWIISSPLQSIHYSRYSLQIFCVAYNVMKKYRNMSLVYQTRSHYMLLQDGNISCLNSLCLVTIIA